MLRTLRSRPVRYPLRYLHYSPCLRNAVETKPQPDAVGSTEAHESETPTPAAERVHAGLESARKRAFQELRGDVKVESLASILQKNETLMAQRYAKPSKRWSGGIKEAAARKLGNRGVSKESSKAVLDKYTGSVMEKALGKPKTTISVENLFTPLNVGDAVELSSSLNQSVLAVIAAVPTHYHDPRYTVMTRLGELLYLEKSAFKFRISGVIPRAWLKDAINKIKEPHADYGSIKTTESGFERFMINPLARQIVSQPLVDLTNDAWSKIQQTSRKLEIIHRVLETTGPREVSLLSLVKAAEVLDLVEFEKSMRSVGAIVAYKHLSESLSKTAGVEFASGLKRPILGKHFGSLDPKAEFDLSLLYSVVLTLRKQTTLWSTQNRSRSAFMPLSITVLPMAYSSRIGSIVEKLKSTDKNTAKEFRTFMEQGQAGTKTPLIMEVLFLLREYAVGNVTDPISETVVCQLMKQYFDGRVTQTLVWNLLVDVGYIDAKMINPQHLTNSLAMPGKDVSVKADIEEQFFQVCEVDELKHDRARHRVDMTNLRVFCIDAATAHEIDDGVSIERVDDKFRVHIHIADPTSYLPVDSTILQIAFERAFTTYQPECISAMFPREMSALAGLGVDGRVTRAMTFSVDVDKDGEVDFSTVQVNATHVSKFPQYTYTQVDDALENLDRSNAEQAELQLMSELSVKLREKRVESGAVVYPDSLSVQVKVGQAKDKTVEEDDDDAVSFDEQHSTKSVVLVTELMILANRVSAQLLKRADLAGVFKTMPPLPLEGSASGVISRLNKISRSGEMGLGDMVSSFKFITPAIYSPHAGEHLMLGVHAYAPSTSPLRRFGDVVNHLQLHSMLNGEERCFGEEQVVAMTMHIEARNDILKKASRGALAYYALLNLAGKFDESSRFVVASHAMNGSVNGILLDYGLFCKLNITGPPPKIGSVLSGLEVDTADPVGQILTLRLGERASS